MFELRYLNALHAKPESFPKRHAFDTPFKRNTRKILLSFKRGFSFKQTKLMYRMHRGKIHSDYKESVVSCFRRNCIDDFSYNIIFLKIYTDDPSFFGVPISILFHITVCHLPWYRCTCGNWSRCYCCHIQRTSKQSIPNVPHHERSFFCICENKGADQMHGNRAAEQCLCFQYIDSTISLLHQSEISSI